MLSSRHGIRGGSVGADAGTGVCSGSTVQAVRIRIRVRVFRGQGPKLPPVSPSITQRACSCVGALLCWCPVFDPLDVCCLPCIRHAPSLFGWSLAVQSTEHHRTFGQVEAPVSLPLLWIQTVSAHASSHALLSPFQGLGVRKQGSGPVSDSGFHLVDPESKSDIRAPQHQASLFVVRGGYSSGQVPSLASPVRSSDISGERSPRPWMCLVSGVCLLVTLLTVADRLHFDTQALPPCMQQLSPRESKQRTCHLLR